MVWPRPTDYNEAIQNPRFCFRDEELRQGQPVANTLGLLLPRSGNFADVYQVNCPGTANSWAVKCFTRKVAGLQQRYQAVSTFLNQVNLPFAVEFQYQNEGIRIHDQWYPIVKMRWVEGLTLNEFVKEHLHSPQLLEELAEMWVKLASRMRQAGLTHGDLQHGNVLLVSGRKKGTLGLRLIDYDGMYVPALAQSPSGEVGHPNFQHPQRLREGTYGAQVDRFAHLVIHSSLRCLCLGGLALWEHYDNGDNLLFREADFQHPGTSPLFQELWQYNDPAIHALVGHLLRACQGPLDDVPLLENLTGQQGVVPLSTAQQKQMEALLASAPVPVRTAPWWASDHSGKAVPAKAEQPRSPPVPAVAVSRPPQVAGSPPKAPSVPPPTPARPTGQARSAGWSPTPSSPVPRRTAAPPEDFATVVAGGVGLAIFGTLAGALGGSQNGTLAGALAGAGWVGIIGWVLIAVGSYSGGERDSVLGGILFGLLRAFSLALVAALFGALGGALGGMSQGALGGGIGGLLAGVSLAAIALVGESLSGSVGGNPRTRLKPILDPIIRWVIVGTTAGVIALVVVAMLALWRSVTTAEILFAPKQVSPGKDMVLKGLPSKRWFRWQPVPHAARYVIEIEYKVPPLGSWEPAARHEVSSPSFEHPFPGPVHGRWRVWAVDAAGRDGPPSDWQEFKYTGKFPVP